MIRTLKTRAKKLTITQKDIVDCETLEIISKSLEEIDYDGKSSLKSLRIYCPKLRSLPSALIDSSELEEIRIKENSHIDQLMSSFINLSNLKNIYLTNVELKSFPDFIKKSLLTLEVLDISKNQISRLPSFFGNASNLKRLILDGNPLEEFDFKREDFEQLKYLSIENTSFQEVVLAEIKQEFNLL